MLGSQFHKLAGSVVPRFVVDRRQWLQQKQLGAVLVAALLAVWPMALGALVEVAATVAVAVAVLGLGLGRSSPVLSVVLHQSISGRLSRSELGTSCR